MAAPTSQKKPIPLELARLLSSKLRRALEPDCERIEVAGSIRRGNKQSGLYGDIEILAIPRMQTKPSVQGGLFFQKAPMVSALWGLLDAMMGDRQIEHMASHRWGDKYRSFMWNGVQVDLFTTDVDSWGYQLLVRTGPSSFSQRFVTRLEDYGYIGRDGHIWTRLEGDQPGVLVPVHGEADAFRLIEQSYLPPKHRLDR